MEFGRYNFGVIENIGGIGHDSKYVFQTICYARVNDLDCQVMRANYHLLIPVDGQGAGGIIKKIDDIPELGHHREGLDRWIK